jgi:hypothetical protein
MRVFSWSGGQPTALSPQTWPGCCRLGQPARARLAECATEKSWPKTRFSGSIAKRPGTRARRPCAPAGAGVGLGLASPPGERSTGRACALGCRPVRVGLRRRIDSDRWARREGRAEAQGLGRGQRVGVFVLVLGERGLCAFARSATCSWTTGALTQERHPRQVGPSRRSNFIT